MFDDIKSSYPPITDQLDAADYEFFLNLPQDYRGFLAAHNGGFVDEFRYTFLTGVPFKTEHVDNPSRDDCPVEFFGIPTSDASEPDDLLQRVVDCCRPRRSVEIGDRQRAPAREGGRASPS